MVTRNCRRSIALSPVAERKRCNSPFPYTVGTLHQSWSGTALPRETRGVPCMLVFRGIRRRPNSPSDDSCPAPDSESTRRRVSGRGLGASARQWRRTGSCDDVFRCRTRVPVGRRFPGARHAPSVRTPLAKRETAEMREHELILHNGRVITLDGASRTTEAIGITAGVVSALGTSSEVLAGRGHCDAHHRPRRRHGVPRLLRFARPHGSRGAEGSRRLLACRDATR